MRLRFRWASTFCETTRLPRSGSPLPTRERSYGLDVDRLGTHRGRCSGVTTDPCATSGGGRNLRRCPRQTRDPAPRGKHRRVGVRCLGQMESRRLDRFRDGHGASHTHGGAQASTCSAVPSAPVLVGSGVTAENVEEMLRRANGTIVGSAVMLDGVAGVDIARAKKLVER